MALSFQTENPRMCMTRSITRAEESIQPAIQRFIGDSQPSKFLAKDGHAVA